MASEYCHYDPVHASAAQQATNLSAPQLQPPPPPPPLPAYNFAAPPQPLSHYHQQMTSVPLPLPRLQQQPSPPQQQQQQPQPQPQPQLQPQPQPQQTPMKPKVTRRRKNTVGKPESVDNNTHENSSASPQNPSPNFTSTSSTNPSSGNAPRLVHIKTKFPVARIKRIMQADEDVGKVAQVTPVVVSKALELFMIALCDKATEQARQRHSKRITAGHLKQAIIHEEQFDFLADIIEKIPDIPLPADGGSLTNGGGENSEDSGVLAKKSRKPRRKA